MIQQRQAPPSGHAPRRDPDPITLQRRPLRSAVKYVARLMDEPRYDFMTDELWLTVLRGILEAHETPHDESHPGHPHTV